MKMLYFRHVNTITYKDAKGNDVEFDTSKLTLKDRLILSAYLTKISLPTKKSLAEIIFDYGADEIFTPGNFKSFNEMVTDVIEKKYIGLISWMDATFAIDRTKKGSRRFSIYAEEIDASDIYKKKNGRSGYSIDSIAWKAFVLAAAASKYTQKNYYLKRVMIINWLNTNIMSAEDIGQDELVRYKANKTQTKRTIQKWLDEVDVDGEFKSEYFYIYGKKSTTKKNEEMKNDVKEKVVEEQTEEQKDEPVEVVEPVEQANDEEMIETPEEKHQRYVDYYFKLEEKDRNGLVKRLSRINSIYHIQDTITNIGRNLGVTHDELKEAARGGYINGSDGLTKKKQIIKKLSELKNRILNAEFDTSWHEDELDGKVAVAYAHKAWPWLMMMK